MIYNVCLEDNKKNISKSIEVALVLKKLNIESTVIGILPQEKEIKSYLKKENIKYKFIENKVIVNAQQDFLDYLKENLQMGDVLVVAGKFAEGIDPVYLIDMAKVAAKAMVHLVVDVPYDTVLDILPLHPLLIKPNQTELKSWYNNEDNDVSVQEEINLAHDMVVQGADHVLLSLGENGAAIVNLMHAYVAEAPEIKFENERGTGATLLATFLAGMLQNHMPVRNLADSIAAASDTAQSEWLTDFEDVAELQKLIIAEKITFEEAE